MGVERAKASIDGLIAVAGDAQIEENMVGIDESGTYAMPAWKKDIEADSRYASMSYHQKSDLLTRWLKMYFAASHSYCVSLSNQAASEKQAREQLAQDNLFLINYVGKLQSQNSDLTDSVSHLKGDLTSTQTATQQALQVLGDKLKENADAVARMSSANADMAEQIKTQNILKMGSGVFGVDPFAPPPSSPSDIHNYIITTPNGSTPATVIEY